MIFLNACLMLLATAPLLFSAVFTQAPSLTETGGKALITFTVSGPTDVEVGIVDKNGKVVRHLAAGVLGGETAPPEPLVSGFAQSLEWDGLDDFGKALYSGPFTARVRLGVFPEFEKRISTRLAFNNKPYVFWSDTSRVYPGNLGLDSNISTDTLIPMTHPVWRSGGGHYGFPDTFPDGTKKIKFYESYAKLDLTVSDEDDHLLIQAAQRLATAAPAVLVDGISGQVLKIWNHNTLGSSLIKSTLYPSPVGAECASAMFANGEPMFDWYGRSVIHDEGGRCHHLYRFTPEGVPMPFSSGTHVIAQSRHEASDLRQRGIATGPDGSIYHGHSAPLFDSAFCKPAGYWYYVSKYDSNGVLVNDSLLKIWGNIGQGLRVDMKGNIFAGIRVRPYPDSVPPAIKPLLQGSATDKYAQNYWARVVYGSIVKFGPGGGVVVPDASGGPLMGGPSMHRARAERMVWMHYGASFQPSHASYVGATCICYAPRFDVDRYGRVLFPNGFENEFKALDNNGNLIFRAHNRDFADKVMIGLFHVVQATDRAIYCADYFNSQIVCFTWKADAEVSLPIPTAAVERLLTPAQVLSVMNSPNPFTPVTRITLKSLQPSESRTARLAVYDASGKKVADLSSMLAAGKGFVDWNAARQPAGVYYLRLSVAGKTLTRAMILMK